MMKILQTNECCVCELVEIYKASQPAISQHLRKLKDIGLVKEKKKVNVFSIRLIKPTNIMIF